MSHYREAKQLKEDYPELTKGFSVYEVMKMWEEFSESFAAGWLTPDEESVEGVFT